MSIMTVLGEIEREALGITLPHEHFFVDLRWACKEPIDPVENVLFHSLVGMENVGRLRRNPYIVSDNSLLDDLDLTTKEVLEFKKAGGRTIIEVSSIGVGRSPAAIRSVSSLTGINVVMGSGYYTKYALSEEIVTTPESELTHQLIEELQYGIGATGIRPGVIGEVGITPNVGEWDEKTLRIAAEGHRESGLPIYIHIQAVPLVPGFTGNPNGIEVLRILESLKVDLEKVVICHCDAQSKPEYQLEVAKAGAYVEFDHFGKEFYVETSDFLLDRDYDRIDAMQVLIEAGYSDQLLMSQDICLKSDLVSFGGWGYAHILTNIVPILRTRGWDFETIKKIMVDNPGRLLNV